MPQHTALVRVYINGAVKPAGAAVDYDGAPDWKYQPTDAASLAQWRKVAADPEKVAETLAHQGAALDKTARVTVAEAN
jgi:hypothetical protein